MDSENDKLEDEPDDRNGIVNNYPLNKKTSDASIYHSAENIAPQTLDAKKYKVYPSLPEVASPFAASPTTEKSDATSNHVTPEVRQPVSTLVLRSAGKYGNRHETIKLDALFADNLDSASLISIESAVFFDDRKRRIDFVLVYSSDPSELSEVHNAARKIFEHNLEDEGLELEHVFQEETGLVFVKIHCTWEVLSRYGEILKFKMPMKEVLF